MQFSPFYYLNAATDDAKKRQQAQRFDDCFMKELVPIVSYDDNEITEDPSDTASEAAASGIFPFHLAFHLHVLQPMDTQSLTANAFQGENSGDFMYFIEQDAFPTRKFAYFMKAGSSSKSKQLSMFKQAYSSGQSSVSSPSSNGLPFKSSFSGFLEGDTCLKDILEKYKAFCHRYTVHMKGQVLQFEPDTFLIRGAIFRAKEPIGFFYQVSRILTFEVA